MFSMPLHLSSLIDRLTQLQLAWLIAFVASLIADIRGKFPHFAWWTIAYDFCIIVGITIVIAADASQTYHVAVCIISSHEDASG